jgi:hypothetical protein
MHQQQGAICPLAVGTMHSSPLLKQADELMQMITCVDSPIRVPAKRNMGAPDLRRTQACVRADRVCGAPMVGHVLVLQTWGRPDCLTIC